MYQVFNMGTRLEIYTDAEYADAMITIAKSYGVDAKVIGRVEESGKKEVELLTKDEVIRF
jgi:phosphoribosylformylglycinamidine cyclo-ligase